jgi:hypothetical protein
MCRWSRGGGCKEDTQSTLPMFVCLKKVMYYCCLAPVRCSFCAAGRFLLRRFSHTLLWSCMVCSTYLGGCLICLHVCMYACLAPRPSSSFLLVVFMFNRNLHHGRSVKLFCLFLPFLLCSADTGIRAYSSVLHSPPPSNTRKRPPPFHTLCVCKKMFTKEDSERKCPCASGIYFCIRCVCQCTAAVRFPPPPLPPALFFCLFLCVSVALDSHQCPSRFLRTHAEASDISPILRGNSLPLLLPTLPVFCVVFLLLLFCLSVWLSSASESGRECVAAALHYTLGFVYIDIRTQIKGRESVRVLTRQCSYDGFLFFSASCRVA